MENGLLYVLAFSAMAIALFACILPQAPLYGELQGIKSPYTYLITKSDTTFSATAANGTTISSSNTASTVFTAVTTAIRDTGGKIHINEGLYLLDEPILVSSGMHFSGATKSYNLSLGTVLRLKDWRNCSIIRPNNLTAQNNDITFEHITFYGAGATQSAGDIIYFQLCNFLIFRDCIFYDAYRDGMRFETGTAQHITIDNCWFQGAYTGSCLSALSMTDSTISNSMFASQYEGGYTGQDGIYVTGNKLNFFNNYIAVSYRSGVYLSASQVKFIGNYIHTNRMRGILTDGATFCTIEGNNIYNNGKYGAGNYAGLEVYSSSNNNTINANIIYDNQATRTQLNGLWVRTGCNYNVVTSNNCWGNTNAQILNDAALTEVHSSFNGSSWIT